MDTARKTLLPWGQYLILSFLPRFVDLWTSVHYYLVFFKKKFGLWWHILWVSKPEWAALIILARGIHVTHSLRFTYGATPANLLVASIAAELFFSTYLQAGIGRAWNQDLSCHYCLTVWDQADTLPAELCRFGCTLLRFIVLFHNEHSMFQMITNICKLYGVLLKRGYSRFWAAIHRTFVQTLPVMCSQVSVSNSVQGVEGVGMLGKGVGIWGVGIGGVDIRWG